LVGLQRDAVN